MRFKTQGGLLSLFALIWALYGVLVPCALWAQASRRRPEASQQTYLRSTKQAGTTPRLLSVDEGLTILGAALESRRHADSRFDCSHLIHAIYERAGFPYTYASSADLYNGVEEFERVTQPQAGDLIVWHGHVGVVISGQQHTFFSALRSGRGVESYDSKYWQKRGRPHFLRYRRPALILAAANEVAGLKLTGLHGSGSREPIAALASPSEDADDPQTPPAIRPSSPDFAIPRALVVNANRPKPADVNEALRRAYDDAAQALEARDLFTMSQAVVVFDNLVVRKVEVKRDQGWADVQIDGPAPLVSANSGSKKRSERQHWGLVRKDQDNWELALPPNAIYISRDVAVRILAHQLTALTDSDPKGNRDRKIQLAALLNALLSQPSGQH